jgi:hypothetical protein
LARFEAVGGEDEVADNSLSSPSDFGFQSPTSPQFKDAFNVRFSTRAENVKRKLFSNVNAVKAAPESHDLPILERETCKKTAESSVDVNTPSKPRKKKIKVSLSESVPIGHSLISSSPQKHSRAVPDISHTRSRSTRVSGRLSARLFVDVSSYLII